MADVFGGTVYWFLSKEKNALLTKVTYLETAASGTLYAIRTWYSQRCSAHYLRNRCFDSSIDGVVPTSFIGAISSLAGMAEIESSPHGVERNLDVNLCPRTYGRGCETDR